jgi:hypothetical protein
MGTSYGAVGVSVTISGNVGTTIPILSTTIVPYAFETAGTGSKATVYTVPASKSFYLYGVNCNADAAQNLQVFAADTTTVIHHCITSGALSGGKSMQSAVPLAVYTAGQTVQCTGTNGVSFELNGLIIG